MVGLAVKVTEVPAQMAPDGEADILTLAGNNGFTVTGIIFDVAGLPAAHAAVDVIITVICSPFTRVVDV